MKKIFKYSVIILFAVMMMTSTIVAFADTHSPSDRCLTQNILAYRPVVMTLVHDDAIIVDPKFTIPHGEESINIQPSQRTEDDRTSNGFVINGTGTYIIEYGLTHAGNKAVTENNPYGQRQIDLTINSAGFPLIFDRDMYSVPDFCKIYTLQITNPPFIPTDEEFAELAYGIITPYIEAVEKQVQLNTDQVQRSDDRTGIFTIIMIGLVALVVFLNNANRKEKAETIEDYRLINQRLRNQEQQNLIDSREFDRRTDEALEKQKNVLKGFMTYFDARVETKINDLGFIIHHFFTTLNEAQFNIPEYQTPEAIDQTFPEPCPCGMCNYTSNMKPVEMPVEIPKPKSTKLDYLTDFAKSEVTTEEVKNLGDKLNQLFKREKKETKEQEQIDISKRHEFYAQQLKLYESASEERKRTMSKELNEYNRITKEMIDKYGY